MSISRRLAAACSLLVLASGCASSLRVTYTSEPAGAALYQGSTQMGITPVTLNYPLTDQDKENGYKTLQGPSVRCISGATANIGSVTADLKNGT
jgi:hypothetical protein